MTRNKTILYVEDDAVTVAAYKNRLEQEGFTVDVASDGIEALKSLYKSKPDLLLLDLMLPRLTGEDVLRFVFSDPRLSHIPVIILSTNAKLTVANGHLVEKADGQILKEICTFEKLLSTVEQVLAKADKSTNLDAFGISKVPLSPKEIQELQNQMQVVCAWTGRIKVDDQWMTISDFLSKRLHLTVSHGVSPEAMQKLLQEIQPPNPPPA